MSSSSECSVDVNSVCFYRQSIENRFEQHRHMRVAAHCESPALERNGFEIRGQFAVTFLGKPRISFFDPGVFIPQFKFVALSN